MSIYLSFLEYMDTELVRPFVSPREQQVSDDYSCIILVGAKQLICRRVLHVEGWGVFNLFDAARHVRVYMAAHYFSFPFFVSLLYTIPSSIIIYKKISL
jgi:hypothetical protein